jgi:adenylylsulfate kinase
MFANVFRSSVAKASSLAMPVRSVLASQARVFSTDASKNVTQTYDHSVKNDGAGSQDIVWSEGLITREDRTKLTGRTGATIWLTGLSGSGKSTIACQLEKELLDMGVHCYRLDGDNIRFGLNKDLGFDQSAREENIRRIGEVSKLFADSGSIAITAFISPYRADRQIARDLHEKAGIPFIEVLADVTLEVAESRDPKGLYKKARKGEIKNFTGISDPYETPENPEITVETHNYGVLECAAQIRDAMKAQGLINV